MSELEKKAKTVNELLIYVHDATGFIGLVPGQGEKLAEYGKSKWVPFEVAQQLEKENGSLAESWCKQVAYLKEDLQRTEAALGAQLVEVSTLNNSLYARIEKAKKVIAEVCKQCGDKEYPGGCQNDCWYHDLESSLTGDSMEAKKSE